MFALRKKKAAQYGSGFDKALASLSGKKKSSYLKHFFPQANLRLGALISSGKDGLYAAWTMMKQNYAVACFITLDSENKDSYMFHTPNVSLAVLQAEACDIPIMVGKTKGEKEQELADLKRIIAEANEKYNLDGIITGALYSNYQRTRIEHVADSLGLKIFSPLWHIDQEQEMRQLLSQDFVFCFSSVAAEGLDASWLGRQITSADVDKLVGLNQKVGLNIAGEGGEFESLVLDCPLFEKKIVVSDFEIIQDGLAARMVVKDAALEEKK